MIDCLYPPFKHWSDGGSVWIISDPHFDDPDCLYMNPNWITPEDHITSINNYVHKNDTLICLGDVGNPEWFNKIKCKNKVLVTGNHDKGKTIYKPYFSEIYDGCLFIADKILLSHEPIWGLEDFCVNIHGHCHAEKDINWRTSHINLAADVANYLPFNLGQAIKSGLLKNVENYHRFTIDKATTEGSVIK